MVRQGTGGRIIFTSSLFGLRGGIENSAYSATKFGINGLMQCLAAELAGEGILVNSVCPGQIDTPMMDALLQERAVLQGKAPDAVKAAMTARIPLGALGNIDDLAGVYVYLASDLSRYTVGQALVVDGAGRSHERDPHCRRIDRYRARCAARLSRPGRQRPAADINAEQAELAVGEPSSGPARAFVCDLADPQSPSAAVNAAINAFGRLDCLFVNGCGPEICPVG